MRRPTFRRVIKIIPPVGLTFGLLISGIIVIAHNRASDLTLTASVEKVTFVVGEPIYLDVRVTNDSGLPREIPTGGVESGELQIFVRRENEKRFKVFVAADWGRLRGGWRQFDAHQSYSYPKVMIFWNGAAKVSHLSTNAQNEILSRQVATEYVFDEPGVYYVKATLQAVPGKYDVIETDPIRVVVEKPEGEDAAIWNRMKANPQLGRFMQTGEVSGKTQEERDKVLFLVESAIIDAPNSRIAPLLREKVDVYRKQVEKRKELYKNVPIT